MRDGLGTRLCDNIAVPVEIIKIGLTLILYEATPFADGHHISHNVHIHNGMVEDAVHTCKQERNHPVKPSRLSTERNFMLVNSDLQSQDTPAESGHHRCSV